MSEEKARKPKAESLPVQFNGLQIGRASTPEKASQILENAVVTFMGFSDHRSPIVRRQLAWNKLAQTFGHEGFDDNVLQDFSGEEGYIFRVDPINPIVE